MNTGFKPQLTAEFRCRQPFETGDKLLSQPPAAVGGANVQAFNLAKPATLQEYSATAGSYTGCIMGNNAADTFFVTVKKSRQ